MGALAPEGPALRPAGEVDSGLLAWNPVKRGFCEPPPNWRRWEWSSFRQYATGCEGRVEIECECTGEGASERQGHSVQLSNCPTQAKRGLEWAAGRLEVCETFGVIVEIDQRVAVIDLELDETEHGKT